MQAHPKAAGWAALLAKLEGDATKGDVSSGKKNVYANPAEEERTAAEVAAAIKSESQHLMAESRALVDLSANGDVTRAQSDGNKVPLLNFESKVGTH